MASSDWKSQLAEFFYDIEQLAKVLLWEIGENPEAERPFDEEFRKFILEESNNRLSIAYSAVQEELQQLNDPVENNENSNNPLNLSVEGSTTTGYYAVIKKEVGVLRFTRICDGIQHSSPQYEPAIEPILDVEMSLITHQTDSSNEAHDIQIESGTDHQHESRNSVFENGGGVMRFPRTCDVFLRPNSQEELIVDSEEMMDVDMPLMIYQTDTPDEAQDMKVKSEIDHQHEIEITSNYNDEEVVGEPNTHMVPNRTKVIMKPTGNNQACSEGTVNRSDVEKLIYERKQLFSEQVRKCDINGILETLELKNSEYQKVESMIRKHRSKGFSNRPEARVIAKTTSNSLTSSKAIVARSVVEKLIYKRKQLFSEQVRKCDIYGILGTLDLKDSEYQTVESIIHEHRSEGFSDPPEAKVIAKQHNPTSSEGIVTRLDVEKLIYERKELFNERVRKCDIDGILETLRLKNSESQTVENIIRKHRDKGFSEPPKVVIDLTAD